MDDRAVSAAPSAWRVQEVVSLAQSTLAVLAHEHGLVLDSDDDILAALAEEHVDLEAVLNRLIDCTLQAKAMGVAADQRIADLRGRRERFQTQETMLRATLRSVMEAMALKKFASAQATLSIAAGKPKVVVTDVDQLPDELVRVTRAPDKPAILAALTNSDVPGAILSNPETVLTLRTR